MDAIGFNSAVSATKTAVANTLGYLYGPGARALAEIALGNPAMLTQLAAMGEKQERGTLTSADYAALLKVVTDIGIAVGVVGGTTISLPIAALWALTGIGLSIYQNQENINQILENLDNLIDSGSGAVEGDPYTGLPWPGTVISPTVNTTPDPLVKTIIYVDPLVLDLDGDGLEITPLSKGILFDANGDAVKTGTAWVGADDGLLVWDRNGNGTIDTGAELFGDETILANGEKAAHGFAALSELDTGSLVDESTVGAGDGVFNAQDAQYSSLRIWRDLNQDGISQANELKTLAQSGVQSISLSSSRVNTNYGDAILAQIGSFTRADGSTGDAGSFILAQNNFVREFVPIAVSDAARALPGLKGSGWVRDLREADTPFAILPVIKNYIASSYYE